MSLILDFRGGDLTARNLRAASALCLLCAPLFAAGQELTAEDLILRMIDQSRGLSSYAELTMTVTRPQWQRTSAFSVWTRGRDDALIRFTAPAKDAGNATLKVGENMWTYSPKIRRSIRLPKSMMSQEWAGSDFSYNDLARSDKLLVHYSHEIVDQTDDGDVTTYTIESRPNDDAPVVWGMERTVLRSDNVVLEQTYFDQEMQPIKSMQAFDIQELGGRTLAKRMRMFNVDDPQTWTEIEYDVVQFDIAIDDRQFTQFALRGE